MTRFILTAISFTMLGYAYGWLYAHETVAKECAKLGGFYVGHQSFYCSQRGGRT